MFLPGGEMRIWEMALLDQGRLEKLDRFVGHEAAEGGEDLNHAFRATEDQNPRNGEHHLQWRSCRRRGFL
jgi:hypothetical protein